MRSPESVDRYIVMHGCPPTKELVTPKENRWMNWLADELSALGFEAIAPDMPDAWTPVYERWKTEFEKIAVTEKTIVIAHSCSGAFIVRWLLETGKYVQKLILVAPAKVPETGDDTRKDLYNFELPETVPHIANEVVIFTSNDFPHHLESLELYIRALSPRVLRLEGKQHFLYFQMKTNEFPELLAEAVA